MDRSPPYLPEEKAKEGADKKRGGQRRRRKRERERETIRRETIRRRETKPGAREQPSEPKKGRDGTGAECGAIARKTKMLRNPGE